MEDCKSERNNSNIKFSFQQENDYTEADSLISIKGGFTLIINPEYHSTSFTNLLRYIKQQCMVDTKIRKPSLFNYILRFNKKWNDKYNGSSALLFDLIEIFPDKTFTNGLIKNYNKRFKDIYKIRSVFMNNKFFIDKMERLYLTNSDIIICNEVSEHKCIASDIQYDSQGRVIQNTPLDTMYFAWSSYLTDKKNSFFTEMIQDWEDRHSEYEEKLKQEFPVALIDDISELKDDF